MSAPNQLSAPFELCIFFVEWFKFEGWLVRTEDVRRTTASAASPRVDAGKAAFTQGLAGAAGKARREVISEMDNLLSWLPRPWTSLRLRGRGIDSMKRARV